MKGVLNKARKSIPTSHGIWMHLRSPNKKSLTRRQREGTQISRNRPQDDQNGRMGVAKARGVVHLRTMVAGSRNARRRGTCEAIVKATAAMKVEEEDRFSTWGGVDEGDRDSPRDFGLCAQGVSESCQVVGNGGVSRAESRYWVRLGCFFFGRSLCVIDTYHSGVAWLST